MLSLCCCQHCKVSLEKISYLVANNEALSIWAPCQRKGITESFDFIDHGSGSDIPEFYYSIAATRSVYLFKNQGLAKATDLLTLQSSDSLTGLNATFSIGAA